MDVESITTVPSLRMLTLMPERVSVSGPGRPALIGMVLMTWPPRVTVEVIDEPTVKLALSSLAIHLSGPVWTPVNGALMVTVVPGFQYVAGRHISWRLSSQPQAPFWAGLVVTLTSFSTWARSSGVATAESNWMLAGMPTPTVSPELRMP